MSIKIKLNNDWVDTNIQAVRGVNHVNSEDVYTKQESDALFSDKVSKSDIVQSTGTSTTSVMSQKAVSDAINKLKNTGYLYAGIATPTTNPGTPDQRVFYFATTPGTYTNFGGIVVHKGDFVLFKYDAGWTNELIYKSEEPVDTFQNAISKNIDINIPLSIFGYVDKSVGVWYGIQNAKMTDYIPILGYEKMDVYAKISLEGASVAFFDKDFQFLKEISKFGTFSGVIDLTNEIYQDAKYVIVSYYDYSQQFPNYKCILTCNDSLTQKVNEVLLSSDMVETNAKDILDIKVAIGENKSYPLAGDDGYIFWNSGLLSPSKNAKTSGKIAIIHKEVLQYHVSLNSAGAAVAFYDKNNNYLQSISVQGSDVTNPSGEIDLSEPQYESAAYFILSYYDSSHLYPLYKCNLVFPNNSLGNRVVNLEKNNTLISQSNLKILIFGDSITDCASIKITDNKTTSYYVNPSYQNSFVNEQGQTVRYCLWPFLITRYLSTSDVRNYAQWGATYKDQEDVEYPRKSLSYQIQVALNDIPNDNDVFPTIGNFVPDVIIFALGTNDGSPNDTFESAMNKTVMDGNNINVDATLANLDRSKFCESARYAFLKIKKQFPQSLCICVLPIQRTAFDIQTAGVGNELRKMAERYSIIVIDGATEMGIIRDLEKNDALGANLKDGLHPNDKGQNLFARLIINAIKNNWLKLSLMNEM